MTAPHGTGEKGRVRKMSTIDVLKEMQRHCRAILDYYPEASDAKQRTKERDEWNALTDAIRQLEWTPVTPDTMPENGKVVLIAFTNAHYPVVGYYSKTYEKWISITGGSYPLSLGTHYRELPQPPESEDAK